MAKNATPLGMLIGALSVLVLWPLVYLVTTGRTGQVFLESEQSKNMFGWSVERYDRADKVVAYVLAAVLAGAAGIVVRSLLRSR